MLLGLAGTRHYNSAIFRREFPRLRAIIERSREIFNRRGETALKDSFNETTHVWRLRDGRTIELGAVQHEKDKETWRGRPHDAYLWDEITEFPEAVFRFVNGWCRSTRPGQRCRVVATGNPPSSTEGEWVIRYWAPWLEEGYPNPAKPGELRWFARIDDKDVEVESGKPFQHKKELIQPRSRTFIPARLSDNPILEATGYGAVLQGLPEPLRSQALYGDFSIGLTDSAWQVIPTAWVREAQARWQPKPPCPVKAVGLDVAAGGKDKTVQSDRHDNWYAPLKKWPGEQTPNGPIVAALVAKDLVGEPTINVDMIGIGLDTHSSLNALGIKNVRGIVVSEASDATDKSGKLQFANKRAEYMWKLREQLDPLSGLNIQLPPDRELLADLCSVRWSVENRKIKIEKKEEIKKRIGRSPDCGESVMLAAIPGPLAWNFVEDDTTSEFSRMPSGVVSH